MKKRLISLLLFSIALIFTASAQPVDHVSWKYSTEKISDTEYNLIFHATLDAHWHLYSTDIPEGGPVATSFTFEKPSGYELVGEIQQLSKVHKMFDETFKMDITYFEGEAVFSQKIKLTTTDKVSVKAILEYQICDDSQCLFLDEENTFVLNEGVTSDVAVTTAAATEVKEVSTDVEEGKMSLWVMFWFAFVGGLLALLTPCVFPMIPMTVSFFTKQSKNKAEGIRNAILYGLSIIVIYVILGTAVAAIFGADSLNALSTNPWFNLFFFVLLVVFAVSFMGAFEIMMPSSWVNFADKKSDKGGLIGIFFMAFTLALVSFSCTGPIVGSLLVQAATGGFTGPIIGMFGFSLALALPFALFAAFPGFLNSLPKSGGWLNSVKVVLGFLELAFAFKFLSNTDMVWDLHVFERETFIAIWIAIFGALGLYLLGKIRLPHDSPMEYLPVSRLMLGLTVIAFTIYMIPGLWGAPLNLISAFPPGSDYAESPNGVGYKGTGTAGSHSFNLPEGMHPGPQGIPAFEDYDKALAYAKKVNKPLILDFTGKACVNCRKMENMVWSDQTVKGFLTNDFILVSLYVDLRKDLDVPYISKATGKKIKTVGQKWADFQFERFKQQGQPYYVLLDVNEKELNEPSSYNSDIEDYKEWLKEGLENFKNR